MEDGWNEGIRSNSIFASCPNGYSIPCGAVAHEVLSLVFPMGGLFVTRLSSDKYLRGSKGQPCTFRIPGYCVGGTDTTVPAHIRDRHKGGGTKASDISVANACFGCHAAFDQGLLTNEEWLFYALRGLQETLEQRIEAGLLIFPHDAPKEHVPKPRKPKSERKAINSRPFPKQSRGWRKREE